jgi:hypothetical protein
MVNYEQDFIILIDKLRDKLRKIAYYYGDKMRKSGSLAVTWQDIFSGMVSHLWLCLPKGESLALVEDEWIIYIAKQHAKNMARDERTHKFYEREYKRLTKGK